MAKPDVILRRPVGSDGPYTEDAALPRTCRMARSAAARQRRDLTTAKAKAALEKAEREHDGMTTAVEDRI